MVSVTAGITEVDFDLASSTIAVAAFVLASALAWIYFDRPDRDRGLLFARAALPPVATVLLLVAVVVADLVYELAAGGEETELPLEPVPERA